MKQVELHHGDCLDVLATLEDNSIDSFVTDPPYGLSDHDTADVVACLTAWMAGEPYLTKRKGFMGKSWDSWVPGPEVWRECYRVLKPGGYLLCFASTRTTDLMSMAIRLAGFRKHPECYWIFGSGFPKAANLSKMLDKKAGAEREKTTPRVRIGTNKTRVEQGYRPNEVAQSWNDTGPATPEAQQWDGWYYGLQSLKPAVEPILMFQKPADRPMTENVMEWGTGAINVDGCRVGGGKRSPEFRATLGTVERSGSLSGVKTPRANVDTTQGRWPANLILSDDPEVTDLFPVSDSARASGNPNNPKRGGNHIATSYGQGDETPTSDYRDSGSAARFFYQSKASGDDRWFFCRDCQDAFPKKEQDAHSHDHTDEHGKQTWLHVAAHPTVKPTDLMRYLVRLVTPPNGTVLDPFCGSGSTLKAAVLEGFNCIGIDVDAEYLEIARRRAIVPAQLPLFSE